MKKAFIALLVVLFAFSSCNWNLSDKDSDLSNVVETSVTETAESVEKVSCYQNGALHSYTVRFISDTAARTVDQEQRYTANGSLVSVWKYHRDGAGLVDVASYYSSDLSLKYYDVYAYAADGKVTTQAEYDGAGTLQWLRRYSAKASGTAQGELETAASFSGSLALTGGLQYYFIDTASYPSKTWNMEVAYGAESASLSGGVKAENPKACVATLTALQTESRLDLTMPTAAALSSPAIPSDFAASGLSVYGYRFSFDDNYGNTTVALDPAWYPVSGKRTDSRLAKAVTVDLTHDAQKRVTSKSLYYGSTLALKVGVTYESGSSLFPTRISTSGSSMLLPFDYVIAYGSPNHEVTGVSVYSGSTLVRRFSYAYSTTPSPVTVPALRGMDPFAFLSSLLKVGLVISEYDGNGALVETFTSSAGVSGVTVTVNKPKADGTAGGDVNGTFSVTYDADGNCASIVAKGADGTVSWSENLASFADKWASLKGAATAAFDDTIPYGTMVESLIAPSDAQTVPEIQDSFVYNLLF